jgi:Protein of unknown function (DUF3999)
MKVHLASFILGVILCLSSAPSHGQEKGFKFKRKINGPPSDGWYALPLPDDIYHGLHRNFPDLRIFQFSGGDTLEVPYLLKVRADEATDEVEELQMLNKSKKDGKLFLTFVQKSGQQVNQLDLDFEEVNFNAYVQLEGSPNQHEWFSIDTLQRILSIRNGDIDFHTTTLNFPLTDYKFLRISIKGDKPLTFRAASFRKRVVRYGVHPKILSRMTTTQNKKSRQTLLDLTLNSFQPVSSVSISTDNSVDFYRPMSIEVVRDSVKTEKGWVYSYDQVYSGYVTSLKETNFQFPFTPAGKIRIIINNADNPPVTVKTISVSGTEVALISQFKTGDNFLFYGNNSMSFPSYDVVHFQDKIPSTLPTLSLGPEENLLNPSSKGNSIFENKLWLWGIMGVIILLLGYFTLKMMKAKT